MLEALTVDVNDCMATVGETLGETDLVAPKLALDIADVDAPSIPLGVPVTLNVGVADTLTETLPVELTDGAPTEGDGDADTDAV